MEPLVSCGWLAGRIGDADLLVADARWYLDPTVRGRDAYLAGHIPGAVFLDIDADLAGPEGGRGSRLGRHPWPDEAQVERVMGGAGIGPATRVVAYDDAGGAMAARVWYLLRAHGHERVAVLDGGIPRWRAEGRPLDASVPRPSPARFEARLRPGAIVTKAEMVERVRRGDVGVLLDARAPERYRGEAEPIDPRAGHIPGASSAPYAGNLTGDPAPVFRPPAELRRLYEGLGAAGAEPIAYCGSGVTSCHTLLALELAGLRGRLYAGSWSEWSSDPELPIETGSPG